MMTPEIIELIKIVGVLGFIGIVCAYVFLSLIRSYTRRSNAETAAQETIRRLYEKLTEDVKQLRADLDTANDKIDELEGLIELSKKTNESLTTERDQFRKDLTEANQKLTDAKAELQTLRDQVIRLEEREKEMRRTQTDIIAPLMESIRQMAAEHKTANGNGEAVKTEAVPAADPVPPPVSPIESNEVDNKE